MAILSQIRNRIGLVFVFIVIALAAFLVSDALSSGSAISSMFSDEFSAGEIAGRDISVQEFQARLNRNLENQGPGSDDQQKELIINQTWQQLVNEVVFDEELSSAGLNVSETEVTDLLIGQNPHPTVKQIQYFWDSTGVYNPQMVQTIMQISQNPEHPAQNDAARIIAEVIEYLYNVRREEKYMNMLKSGMLVSANEARFVNDEESKTFNVSFFAANYSTLQDSSSLTDAQYRAYYNEHKEEYKQDLQVTLNYVRFGKYPSKEDSLKAYNATKGLMANFKNSDNDQEYILLHSDNPQYDSTSKTMMQVTPDMQRRLAGVTGDTVLGPIVDGPGYVIHKVSGLSDTGNSVVNVRHILVRALSEEEKGTARTKANELRQRVASEGFAAVVGESADFQTPNGELGWIDENRFGPDFWGTVSGAAKGSTVIAESPQGIHIVEVLDKSKKSFVMNTVYKEMFVGTQTSRELYSKASQFASLAFTSNSIQSAADSTPGVNMSVTPIPITAENASIQGLPGGRNIAAWALRSESGEISSQIFDLTSDYVVAQVDSRTEEGYRPLDDALKAEIESEVRKEAKGKIILEKLKGIAATDLNSIKEAYGPGGFVSTASGISIGGAQPPAPLTSESFLIGKIAGLPLNQLSKPLVGESGVYIFQVTQVTDPTPLVDENALNAKVSQMQNARQFSMENKFRLALRELANVKDTRYQFDF